MNATVLKEIEQLRSLTVERASREVPGGLWRGFPVGKQGLLVPADCLAASGQRRRRSCPSVRAAARWKSPTMPTCGSGRRRASPGPTPSKRTAVAAINGARDPRLPQPGTLLTREFKGKVHVVKVLDGRLRVRRAAVQVAEQDRHRDRRHPLERFHLLRAGPGGAGCVTAGVASEVVEPAAAAAQVRCAIYTRKSTDEGLSQEFN